MDRGHDRALKKAQIPPLKIEQAKVEFSSYGPSNTSRINRGRHAQPVHSLPLSGMEERRYLVSAPSRIVASRWAQPFVNDTE